MPFQPIKSNRSELPFYEQLDDAAKKKFKGRIIFPKRFKLTKKGVLVETEEFMVFHWKGSVQYKAYENLTTDSSLLPAYQGNGDKLIFGLSDDQQSVISAFLDWLEIVSSPITPPSAGAKKS